METTINHPGEVMKARAMYNSYNIIATKTNEKRVFLFDYAKQSFKQDDNSINAQMILEGLESEGWGLDWKLNGSELISSDNNGYVCIWDLEKSSLLEDLNESSNPDCLRLNYTSKFRYSENSVNEVKFHKYFQNFFGLSCQNEIAFYDMREGLEKPLKKITDRSPEIFSFDFSFDNEYLFLSGGAGGVISLWDFRKLNDEFYNFSKEGQTVIRVEWSPSIPGLFASAGEDSKIRFWDCSKLSDSKSGEGLFFVHHGHSKTVNDISWNPCEPFSMASVDSNNQMHIFRTDKEFFYNNDLTMSS